MKTQLEIIKEKLLKDKVITNVWAVKNYILRLSERIRELKEDGMIIHGEFIKKGNKKTRTYQYYI